MPSHLLSIRHRVRRERAKARKAGKVEGARHRVQGFAVGMLAFDSENLRLGENAGRMETENPLVVDTACGAGLSGAERAPIIMGQ